MEPHPGEEETGIRIRSIGRHSMEHFLVVRAISIEQAQAPRVLDGETCMIPFVNRHVFTVTRIDSPAVVSSHQLASTLEPRHNLAPELNLQ